jgi:pantetheine-phosphate adenylyltransferase
MTERRIAVYPASFDPITNGHIDIIHRAAGLFDELIVAVARNLFKEGLFALDERMEMIHAVLDGRPNIRIDTISGLLVDYARENRARVIVRGLRVLADFEYEFEMAMMNSHMNPNVETVFLMTSPKWFYVSSSRLRELVRFGADVSAFVPPHVSERLKAKLARA